MGVGGVLSDDDQLTMVYSEVLSPPRSAPLSDRLGWLLDRMSRAMEELRPSVVAIEQPFLARNVKAALAVGQAQAVAMIAAARLEIPVANYSPSEVKKAVTDYGSPAAPRSRCSRWSAFCWASMRSWSRTTGRTPWLAVA